MELVYVGKTKDVYALPNGHLLLRFKDDVTGADGVFDPGANTVGLVLEGAGRAGLRLTTFFFETLRKKGIPTHYIDTNMAEATMTVKPATVFGQGLEVICRYRAVGSFFRRFGSYIEEGHPLPGLVEMTLKDDERGDPPIDRDALHVLGILSPDEYQTLKALTKQVASVVRTELAARNLDLYDIKLEFGRTDPDDDIVLIDEISGGNMRVYRNGEYVAPLQLTTLLLGEA